MWQSRTLGHHRLCAGPAAGTEAAQGQCREKGRQLLLQSLFPAQKGFARHSWGQQSRAEQTLTAGAGLSRLRPPLQGQGCLPGHPGALHILGLPDSTCSGNKLSVSNSFHMHHKVPTSCIYSLRCKIAEKVLLTRLLSQRSASCCTSTLMRNMCSRLFRT